MTTVARIWRPVELVRWTAGYLAERNFEDPRLEAELLLAGVLGVGRLDLYLQFERPLSPEELAEYKTRLKRRLRREPIQYIEGTAAFRTLELTVNPHVLIPRPETEQLVQAVLDAREGGEGRTAVDIGTGSGAIALSLASEGQFRSIVATDVSTDALALAAQNARSAGLESQVEFRHGSLFEPLEREAFDVIVSNPPYVAEHERASLQPEVVEWEPAGALFGGRDGLDVIRALITGAPAHLRPGGLLALEIGADQGEEVTRLIRQNREFGEPRLLRDYADRDRIVLAERIPRPALTTTTE